MSGRLRGRLVLITGASEGIGRAASREFVASGARVLGLARNAERLEALSQELGGPAHLVPLRADVADAAMMEAASARILAEFGAPDVIVANAGIGLDALLVETTDEALRAVFEVNVFGLVRTVRPFLPRMIERGSGRVVFVSSIVGKRGIPHYAAYSGSKFAVQGIADALHAELVGSGVSLGVICPSTTESAFRDRVMRQGPAQRSRRPRRHSAESVARALVRMAGSRRREMVPAFEGKLMVLADLLAPRLVDAVLAHVLRR